LALTPGTRLGVYEVTAQIGEGGMGQVFVAARWMGATSNLGTLALALFDRAKALCHRILSLGRS
jgi:hypothetical protein